MKKRICLTVDESVYNGLQEVPRGVSISEVVSFLLKAMIEDVRKGREMTQEEFDEWIESTEEGREFRERFIEKYGHFFKRLQYGLDRLSDEKKKKKKK